MIRGIGVVLKDCPKYPGDLVRIPSIQGKILRELHGNDVQTDERLKANAEERQDLGHSSRTQQTDGRQS
jgi:hypothetical protein